MLSLLWVNLCFTLCVLTRAGISCRRTNFSGCAVGRGRKLERWNLRHRKARLGQFPAAVLTDDRLKIMGIHHLGVLEASCPALVSPDSTLTAGQPTFLLESLWEMVSPSVFQLLVAVLIPWLVTPHCIASYLFLSLHPFFLTLLPSSFCFKTIVINQIHQRNSE